MQTIYGSRRRKNTILGTAGLAAGGGAAAGLTSFGLRRGVYHFKRIRRAQAASKIITGTTNASTLGTVNRVAKGSRIRSAFRGFGKGIRRFGGHMLRSFARMPV